VSQELLASIPGCTCTCILVHSSNEQLPLLYIKSSDINRIEIARFVTVVSRRVPIREQQPGRDHHVSISSTVEETQRENIL
jgi:hypothetical protein